jgi:hypothetical protein
LRRFFVVFCQMGMLIALTACGHDKPSAPVDGDDAVDVRYDGGTLGAPCTVNTDCDPLLEFCGKDVCDPTTVGVCVARAGGHATALCTPVNQIVCGCDGVTYPYACIANSYGVNIASLGPCIQHPVDADVDARATDQTASVRTRP